MLAIKEYFNKDQSKVFLVLILVIFIMFLSSYYVFLNSTKTIFVQARANNALLLENMIKSFDDSFIEASNMINSLYGIPFDVYDGSTTENFNYNCSYSFIKEVQKLAIPEFVSDFIIYSSKSRIAINSEGSTDFNVLINQKYRNSKYAAEYWMNLDVTSHYMTIIPADDYVESELNVVKPTKHKYLAIVGSNKFNNSKFNVVAFIDIDKLLNYVNNQNMMQGTSFVIMDKDKKIVLSTDNNFEKNIFDEMYIKNGQKTNWSEGKFEYNYIVSELSGCTYISKMPRNYDNILLMMKTNQIIIFGTIFILIILAYFLSRYLYKPIKSIITLISSKDSIKKNRGLGDIYKGIEHIQLENTEYKTQLDNVMDDVRSSIFFRLIDDMGSYNKLKNQLDKYFTVVFTNKKFMIVAFYLEYKGGINGKQDENNKINSDEMQAKIQERLNVTNNAAIVFYAQKSVFISIIGINDSTGRQSVLDNIMKIIRQLNDDFGNAYNIVSAVSSFYTRIEECKDALKDIKKCLAYRSIKATLSVIDAEKPNHENKVYFPLECIEMLSNHMMNGNIEESISIVNNIIYTNIKNNVSYIKLINVISVIFNNIINYMAQYGFDRNEILNMEKLFYEKIEEMDCFDQVSQFMESILVQTLEKIKLKNQSKLNKEFIAEYINLHYGEELYLDKMAEITGTTTKYFSNYFKKTMGINFIEYLNNVRMRHAKELLTNTNIPVGEIGKKVGLPLHGTFAGTFKKYCGISPTVYRNNTIRRK